MGQLHFTLDQAVAAAKKALDTDISDKVLVQYMQVLSLK